MHASDPCLQWHLQTRERTDFICLLDGFGVAPSVVLMLVAAAAVVVYSQRGAGRRGGRGGLCGQCGV